VRNVIQQQRAKLVRRLHFGGSTLMRQQRVQNSPNITHTHTHTHTHTQSHIHTHPFYGTFPGLPWQAGIRRNLLMDFMVKGKINRGRHTDRPAGRHSMRTNRRPPPSSPHFLCRMPFLPQPSHFILAWDSHEICWIAYPVVWLKFTKYTYPVNA